MELIIISGRSGAGKSVALRALEDAGYYCVDNIPFALIPQLARFLAISERVLVISLDIRNLPEANTLDQVLNHLSKDVISKLIFLDCDRSTLIRRYSDSRRLHPLSNQDLSLEDAIDLEHNLLLPLYQQANYIIDTSHFSSHDLAEHLRSLLTEKVKELNIVIESFGFKYGLPDNADYIFDVRFLPNPHWNIELRPMTGLDQPVIEFLKAEKDVQQFIKHTCRYIEMWLPMLEKNNRSYLTIAIGCTGGKHRSVYIAEQIGLYFKSRDKSVKTRHRSLEKHHALNKK